MCHKCGPVHREFLTVADSYRPFEQAPEHGNVLLIACGDEVNGRLKTVRLLHEKSFSGEHSATMTHAGGPLAFIDTEGVDWLLKQVRLFIRVKDIECVHLCVHTDCAWAMEHGYTWRQVEEILLERVVPLLQTLATKKGRPLLVVPTIYGENGQLFTPRLMARVA